jgi:putative lipoprotein
MRLKAALTALFAAVALTACGGGDSAEPAEPASDMKTLGGSVMYRERIALPVNATINVRLLDVSLADAPARVLAEQTIDARGKSVPIPYTLEYDPAHVRDNFSYAVRAEIRDGAGDLLWTTDTVHPVLTRGAPSDGVEIRVIRVAN